MDLRQLDYVVGVVDHGSFTAAAEALGVAQPSLSQGVRALEAELGVELFHRTGRAVVLTAAGEAIVEPARQALRDAATARAAVAEVAGVRAGHLDLVCLATLAVDPVAALVGPFRRRHPEITVRLIQPEDAASVAELVRNGFSEIGFAELPLVGLGLEAHPLKVQDYVAVLPRDVDRTLRPGRLSVTVLAQQPLITTPVGTSTRRIVDEAFAAAGATAHVAVETDHRDAIGALVAAGAGIALLPREVATVAVRSGVVMREVTPKLVRRVGLIHRSGPLSPAAHAFVAIAVPDRMGTTKPRPRPRRR